MREHDQWLESRWMSLLAGLGIANDESARQLRVKRLEVQSGYVRAQVRDLEGRNCDVEVWFRTFTDDQWERIIEALGSQALYTAELLSGHMPPEIEKIFAQLGISLLPVAPDEHDARCSCCEPSVSPCAEVVAVYRELAQMLADDPWLLFQLRGRDRQPILRALQERRRGLTEGVRRSPSYGGARVASAPPVRPGIAAQETSYALVADATGFWELGERLDDVHHHIMAPAVDLLLLRRLGPPPLDETLDTVIGAGPGATLASTPDAYTALSEVYHRVTRRALDLAYAVDPVEDLAEG